MAVVFLIVIESGCVGCPTEMGCLYEACPYYKITRFYCDKCHEETEDLYKWNNEEWCADCIINDLERVEYND